METKAHLTIEQRSDIVKKYQNGCSVAQLTREFKVTRPTVYKILSKANFKLKNELFSEKYKENKEMESTTFLGVTIDTINGPLDFKVKKALKQSVKLLDIMEFIKVTKFKLNMTMFDYFWQVVVGNRSSFKQKMNFIMVKYTIIKYLLWLLKLVIFMLLKTISIVRFISV